MWWGWNFFNCKNFKWFAFSKVKEKQNHSKIIDFVLAYEDDIKTFYDFYRNNALDRTVYIEMIELQHQNGLVNFY